MMNEAILIVAALVGISPLLVGIACHIYRVFCMIRDPMAYVDWHI